MNKTVFLVSNRLYTGHETFLGIFETEKKARKIVDKMVNVAKEMNIKTRTFIDSTTQEKPEEYEMYFFIREENVQ